MEDNFSWLKDSGFGNTYSFLLQVDIEQERFFIGNIKNIYRQIKSELLQSYDELNQGQQELLLNLINVRIDVVKDSTTLNEKEERLIYLRKIRAKLEELIASNTTTKGITPQKGYTLNTQLLMLDCVGVLRALREEHSDVNLSKILSVILNKSEQNIREALGQNDRTKQKGPIEEFRKVCTAKKLFKQLDIFEKEIKQSKK